MAKAKKTIKDVEITSLASFTEYVEKLPGTKWYRGAGNANYKLTPSLFRHPIVKTAEELFKYEYEILIRFKQRSLPFVVNPINPTRNESNLEYLFLMQHFGVPTRLLDWSENPYIALYFALTSADYDRSTASPIYKDDVCVWILDPVEWNKTALDDVDPSPGILTAFDNDFANGYLPAPSARSRKKEPVMMYGVHNNMRIVAQRGVFAIFGTNIRSMEEAYIEHSYPQDSLIKLRIPSAYVKTLLDTVTKIGITDSMVFPDLTGLATEMKRVYNFWA